MSSTNILERAANALAEVKELVVSGNEVIASVREARERIDQMNRDLEETCFKMEAASKQQLASLAENGEQIVRDVRTAQQSVEQASRDVREVHSDVLSARKEVVNAVSRLHELEGRLLERLEQTESLLTSEVRRTRRIAIAALVLAGVVGVLVAIQVWPLLETLVQSVD